LTYSRPTKYPAASRTITTRIVRDAGKVLCVAIIEEYLCNGPAFRTRPARVDLRGHPDRYAVALVAGGIA
jgi:hypothetical protein